MKRKHFNLLLGVVSLCLVAVVYFSREKPEPPPPPLTSLNGGDINRLLVRHAGKPDIRLEKRAQEWWLVAPVETRAEAVEVAAILDLVTRPSQRQYPVAEMELAELSLDNPDWTIQLNDLRIEFGGLNPIESHRYVRVGETVHLIEDPPSAALDADYNDLVARQLLPKKARIQHVQLPTFTLKRNEKDGWSVTPQSADRGADAAQQLVDAWQRAQAMWVTPLDKKLATRGTVSVQAGEETFRFSILDRNDQLVLARPELGVQFALSKTLDSDLFELKPPAEKQDEIEPDDESDLSP